MVAPTRRTLLRRAGAGLLAGSGLAALAGCGGGLDDRVVDGLRTAPTRLPDGGGGDADLLNGALDAEHVPIAAYNAGAPLLEKAALAAAQRFLAHDRAHAERLRALVRGLGATPVGLRPSYDFGRPDRASDVLRLLERVEREALATQLDVLPRLAGAGLRAELATIVANRAEHLVVVRGLLGRQPVPAAFVTGSS